MAATAPEVALASVEVVMERSAAGTVVPAVALADCCIVFRIARDICVPDEMGAREQAQRNCVTVAKHAADALFVLGVGTIDVFVCLAAQVIAA